MVGVLIPGRKGERGGERMVEGVRRRGEEDEGVGGGEEGGCVGDRLGERVCEEDEGVGESISV